MLFTILVTDSELLRNRGITSVDISWERRRSLVSVRLAGSVKHLSISKIFGVNRDADFITLFITHDTGLT